MREFPTVTDVEHSSGDSSHLSFGKQQEKETGRKLCFGKLSARPLAQLMIEECAFIKDGRLHVQLAKAFVFEVHHVAVARK